MLLPAQIIQKKRDGKRVSVYDNCKIVADINPARRDENIDYYLDKLKLLYKKLAPVLTEKHRP